MFGRRRRQEQVFAVVGRKMDEEEEASWRWQQPADAEGDSVATERYGRRSVVDIVEELLPLAGNDVGPLMEALHAWYSDRTARYKATDEDRSSHVSGQYAGVALHGIGNLFGFVPEDAPSYDAGLARVGRERGWRAT